MRKLELIGWICLFISVGDGSAIAHHSFAMYDPQKVLTFNCTVTQFQWSNPHAIVWVSVSKTADKGPELWTIELPTSPAGLVRMGWDKHSLNVGDELILEINPLRDGQHGGSFRRATVAGSGKVLAVTSALTAIAELPKTP